MCNTRVNITTSQHTFPYRTTKDKSFFSVFKFRNSIHLSNRLDSPPFFPSFEKPGNHKPRIKRIEIQFKRNHSTFTLRANWKLHSSEFHGRTNGRCVTRLSNYTTDTDHLWITRIEPQESCRTRPTEPLLTCSSFYALPIPETSSWRRSRTRLNLEQLNPSINLSLSLFLSPRSS